MASRIQKRPPAARLRTGKGRGDGATHNPNLKKRGGRGDRRSVWPHRSWNFIDQQAHKGERVVPASAGLRRRQAFLAVSELRRRRETKQRTTAAAKGQAHADAIKRGAHYSPRPAPPARGVGGRDRAAADRLSWHSQVKDVWRRDGSLANDGYARTENRRCEKRRAIKADRELVSSVNFCGYDWLNQSRTSPPAQE